MTVDAPLILDILRKVECDYAPEEIEVYRDAIDRELLFKQCVALYKELFFKQYNMSSCFRNSGA